MSKKQKKELTRIICAAVLFTCGEIIGHLTDFSYSGHISAGMFIGAFVLCGYPSFMKAAVNIIHGQVFDENFLMSLATVGALCLQKFDEAAAVMIFYQVGTFFEDRAVEKSRASISDLMDIRPDFARVLRNGAEEKVDPYDIAIGESIIVNPGEKVPLDGKVLSGSSSLDTSALTGESVPRDVSKGDEITSGCISLTGSLTILVESEYGESTVSKILDLIENSGSKKATTEKFITRFARYYTPIVVISAAVLALVPPFFISGQSFSTWVYRALLFLIISCPCALVISVPLSFFGGIGASGRLGILVKGGNYLEVLAKTKTMIFDKTGTLTTGHFTVTDVEGKDTLRLAAIAESRSNHPIALSICEAYEGDVPDADEISEITGKGIRAVTGGRTIYAGNIRLMEDIGITGLSHEEESTTVYVADDNGYVGLIRVSDALKEDCVPAIKELRSEGVKHIVMLTGDRKAIAEKMAKNAGADEVKSELLPQDKVAIEESIIAESALKKEKVAFTGDGINDAPVLALADVGIAMGAMGSQAAIEAADIVIMDDKLSKLPAAIRIARYTLSIAKQNIVFALSVKGIILVLGAMGYADLWMAIFADVGVSVIAIINSMRTLTAHKKLANR